MTKSFPHHDADSSPNDFGVPDRLHYKDYELLSDEEMMDVLFRQKENNIY